ncbi:lysophospholipid acyltransferase family protein [Nakamurella antarctica]|uniref:lysophospholipid acyltransferase family protein n=1 Tax=Nakamurella antarctica TaxID=1902245 RepID=UPI0013DDD875|nr:lysophospholipid acyltransferase family protein [Nakamurella antarctica]
MRASTPRALFRIVRAAVAVAISILLVGARTGWRGHGRRARESAALRSIAARMLRALGISVQSIGAPRSGPSLVVANHQSWLDILVLSAAAPMVPVAKSEVGNWPVIGWLARKCGTLFVRRSCWRDLPSVVAQMTLAMRQGHRVQIFPEATTRCGGAVDEFYRSAFQAAIDAAVVVQPVALQYRQGHQSTTAAAFVGEMNVMASVRRVLTCRQLTVTVNWLPAIPAIAGTGVAAVDRRRLCELAFNAVARALNQDVIYRQQAHRPRNITSADSITNPGAIAATSAVLADGSTSA